MIWSNSFIAAMKLAAAAPEVFFIENDNVLFPLPPPTFSALFCCNRFVCVSFIKTFGLSWEIVLKSFLKISSRFNG